MRSVLISVFTLFEELFCHTDHAAARWTQVSPCEDYHRDGLECCGEELKDLHKFLLMHAHYQDSFI